MTKKFKWGILGAGAIARKFASDLQLLPNAELYAIGSRSQERASTFAKEFGIAKAYGSYEDFASDSEIDVVYVASRHVGHYADSLLCLEHGKHVLCEKPVAMNQAQFEKMVAKAREKNLFFMEALWTRFIPSFLKLKEMVQAGEIGEVKLIEADFCFNPTPDPKGRLYNPALGGGALLDIGIYPLFFALQMGSKVKNMKAIATLNEDTIDTNCSLLIQHEKGEHSVLFSSIQTMGRIEASVYGTKGTLRLNKWWHTPSSVTFIPEEGDAQEITFSEPGNGYQYEAVEVMECISRGVAESEKWSWENSRELIGSLDKVRAETGIKYPDEVESV